jgi:hypothetical protein
MEEDEYDFTHFGKEERPYSVIIYGLIDGKGLPVEEEEEEDYDIVGVDKEVIYRFSFDTKLRDALMSNHVYLALKTTPSFRILFMGTDLTKPFKRAVQQCKDRGVCTFSVTKQTRTMQYAFWCETCFPGGTASGMVICEPCAINCHKGHDVSVRVNGETGEFDKTFMFCDCGDILDCKRVS